MVGWHVARHWAAGDGGGAPLFHQNGVDVKAISNLAIGFPLFRNSKLSYRLGLEVRLEVELG